MHLNLYLGCVRGSSPVSPSPAHSSHSAQTHHRCHASQRPGPNYNPPLATNADRRPRLQCFTARIRRSSTPSMRLRGGPLDTGDAASTTVPLLPCASQVADAGAWCCPCCHAHLRRPTCSPKRRRRCDPSSLWACGDNQNVPILISM